MSDSKQANAMAAKIRGLVAREHRVSRELEDIRAAIAAVHSALGVPPRNYYERIGDYVAINECVLRIVAEHGPISIAAMTPMVDAMRSGTGEESVRSCCYALASKGELMRVGKGKFAMPNTIVTVPVDDTAMVCDFAVSEARSEPER